MKSLFGIVMCMALLSTCQKDKQENLKGSVVFKVQAKDASNLKSTGPIAAAIIITIENNGGGVVYDKEKLELSYLNGSYLSKGLPLSQGGYNLTEFLVTDANNQIIYATPKKGSILAQLVSQPLPFSFDVSSNQESILVPEVIKTDTSSLEDLGYIGFSFNPVKSIKFLITVLSLKPDQTNFEGVDSCNLLITPQGSYNIYYDFKLGKAFEVNPVYLRKDTGKYILTVWKQGYNSWVDTLTESQLENYSTSPLQVILKPIGPSIWFSGMNYDYGIDYIPVISVKPGTVLYIDDGRGVAKELSSYHTDIGYYLKNRIIQIYGDVAGIKTLSFMGSRFEEIYCSNANIRDAVSLEEISLSWTFIGKINLNDMHSLKKLSCYNSSYPFKFTNCTSLESIDFVFGDHYRGGWDTMDIRTNDNLKELRFDGFRPVLFGKNPNLKSIHIGLSGSCYVFAEQMNRLLTGLLASVESSPRSGEFVIDFILYNNFSYPTNDGNQAVKTLMTKYNWSFNPDLYIPEED